MLAVADDAIRSAAESGSGNKRSEKLDGKFATVINLLVSFEKDLLSGTSDPYIVWMVTREANMSDTFKSPSMILHALKQNLHSQVILPSVSLPLEADEFQPMGDSRLLKSNRLGVSMFDFKFYLLSTLPDAYPIVVERACYTIDVDPSI